MQDLQAQVAMGPRVPGSEAHAEFRNWISETTLSDNWIIKEYVHPLTEPAMVNLSFDNGVMADHWILLGAHYDSRAYADQSPDAADKQKPVPGANDSASGVAILTELARSLPENLSCHITLVFFDAEDQGDIAGRNWSEGSAWFVETLTQLPDEVVIVDMVADKNLQIYRERNSTPNLIDRIWDQAASLGYEKFFINQPKFNMIDDHIPFLASGIDTTLIIDFDYPAWHTLQDDMASISEESLAIVGETLYHWLVNHPNCQP